MAGMLVLPDFGEFMGINCIVLLTKKNYLQILRQ